MDNQNQNSASKWKPSIVTIIVIFIVVAGMMTYLWTSQYYYPNNYLPATGTVVDTSRTGGNSSEDNYFIAFKTQDGRQVTYKYQTFVPTGSVGPTIYLHYNKTNPEQVRIKPSTTFLIEQLAFILIVIPLLIYIFPIQIKNRVQKYKNNSTKV